MKIGKVIAISWLMLQLLGGIATAQENTAQFSLIGKTDSEKTLGRHYTVNRYLDDTCTKPKRGSRMYRAKYVDDVEVFDTIDIPSSEPFIFQVDYEEKRRDTERSCSASIGFNPEAGRRYRADYDVSGQVSRCRITLYDVTEGEVELTPEIVPETMCTKRGANGNSNGVPTHAMIERF
ncbi:hypothetical protein [Arenicella chitinivorans]|nr:hypothetical protein [Arenicella chitinivorans]